MDRVEPAQKVPAVARPLSPALKPARGGVTTDDATLLLIEWRGPACRAGACRARTPRGGR
ncbi:hypothetical protein GCM10010244_01980 [Streptomyces coeruleorubidus]|nr:hypothetical protein GCM10010244_01980 [Streptomyces bellus]